MKKLLLTLALCLTTLTPVQSAGVLFLAQAPVVSNHTSLDGTASQSASTNGFTINFTNTKAGDVIVLAIQINSTFAMTVSDTAGLTWTLCSTTQHGTMQLYCAYSSGILTADTITVAFNSGSSFYSTVAFGIAGVPSSSQLDPNGALPGITTTGGTPLTLTTSNANDFLFACYSLTSNSATAGSGWTAVLAEANFMFCEYQIVTATQSALAANLASNANIKNGQGHAAKSM